MASNTAAPPVTLNQENIPDDFICSICLTVPVDPLITPCDHMFCKPCIRQALTHNNLCPIDRRACTVGQLKRLEGLSFRVWSGIQVKCGGQESGCAWRGSIADYAVHTQNCIMSRAPTGNNVNALTEQLESSNDLIGLLKHELQMKQRAHDKCTACAYINTIESEKSVLRDELESAERLIESLKEDKKNLKKDLRYAEEKIDDLKEDKKDLKQSLRDRPDLPGIKIGNYDFRRENVVELSQLISRYLEDKPCKIDSNKIYNCVRACFTDLEKGYGDNPAHYYMDMRMLLATCLACNWFTDNQLRSIKQWNKDHFG
ncbi:hypothetical protein QTG54_016152 [Skeletonema marinoi]|uniref:RING-type domain-containing protein n=1 Tax=Skeletonema marinoi TaxID=267567 RepID=A0AAD8XTH0_9STRA|nr:hypothetical protein QTG54_016152 [Skeletonema marinoi]